MAYFVIENFKAGVDTRSPIFASEPGTLTLAQDVHLTAGGHLEVRKRFVEVATLPDETYGLVANGSALYTFGSIADPGLPTGFTYQRLQHPSATAMSDIADTELFDSKFYVIADFNGEPVHFYDGTRVPDWEVSGISNPDAYAPGRAARTIGSKMYAIAGSNLHFSNIFAPSSWLVDADPTVTGSGFINLAGHSSGSEVLVGAELYYENLAVFSQENVQLWSVAADPTDNVRVQTLRGAGLVGPRATVSYLDGDTFFLSYQGVKAIKTKDSSGRSSLEDVSAPVDDPTNDGLVAYLNTLSSSQRARAALLVEPENNRLWVVLGQRIYVLSWFPSKGIKAWTEYRPSFEIDAVAVANRRIYVRSGNTVYLYGGPDNDQFFTGQAIVRLPHADLRAPATYKTLLGFDAGVEGTWEVWAGQRPDEPDTFERLGIITGQTYDKPTHPLVGDTTHVSFEFRHSGDEYARLSSLALHYRSHEAG